jgi:hypothetical protein
MLATGAAMRRERSRALESPCLITVMESFLGFWGVRMKRGDQP